MAQPHQRPPVEKLVQHRDLGHVQRGELGDAVSGLTRQARLGLQIPMAAATAAAAESDQVRRRMDIGPGRAARDSRIAKLLGVEVGTSVMRRFRVTGPESEPPFQINISCIHPRGVEAAPEVASPHAPGPGDWLYRLERAGHWPISWTEFHRARMPTKDEAALLEISTTLPVLEIVRVGTSGSDGQPIEVTEYIVASDRVETVHVLQRDESAQDPWPDIDTPEDKETGR